MINEYSINEILELPNKNIPYYVGTFEGTDDPDIEWPHRHAFYSLVWFTEGNGFYVVDFQEYEIKKNGIFFVNPKQVHNWDYSENSKGYVLIVDILLSSELPVETTYPYIDITTENNLFEDIFSQLLDEYKRQDEMSDRHIKSDIAYLYSLSERIAGENKDYQSLADDRMQTLRQLVYENHSLHKVEDYARKVNMPEDTFNTLVKTSTGISAKQYILDLKITEAKRQLIYSQFNINEIAFNLGFEDPSYFTRLFKKKTNLSPSAFLKKYRTK